MAMPPGNPGAIGDAPCIPHFGCSIANKWLDQIVSQKVSELATIPREPSDPGCLFGDMSGFLVQAIAALSHLADGLIDGEHMDAYLNHKLNDMEQEHGFSELTILDTLNDKRLSLKAIAIQLSNTADLVTRTWSQSHQASSLVEKPYSLAEQTDMSGMVEHDMGSPTGPEFEPPSYPERPGDKSDAGDSPGSNNFQPAVDHLLMSLANRGKGTYVCPYGTECKRGGIDREGRLVTFERNSSFRTHLQKHEKLYKCDIPGCKNKKGLARIDQLRRHKQTTAHS